MPIVYVTQIPHKRDPYSANLVPAFSIQPALEHGEVRVLFPPQTAFVETSLLLDQLDTALLTYDADAGDCLLPLGDPVVYAAAIAVLARRGSFQILRYDKMARGYVAIWIGTPTHERRQNQRAIL